MYGLIKSQNIQMEVFLTKYVDMHDLYKFTGVSKTAIAVSVGSGNKEFF